VAIFGCLIVTAKECEHFRTWVNSSGSRKNSWIARGLVQELLQSGKRYTPGQKLKRLNKSCSLHLKNFFFDWSVQVFVGDIISGGHLGRLGPLHLALGSNH